MLCLLATLAVASCGPAVRPAAAPPPLRLDAAAIREIAVLLRLEDRREYDEPALRHAAGSAHPEIRRRAAMTLGRIRAADGLPLLVHLLADADSTVAAAAAFGLGQLGDTTAVAVLAAQLAAERRQQRPTVAAEAAAALGKLVTAEAHAALRDFLRTAPAAEGSTVAQALLAVYRHPRDEDLAPILRWTEAVDPEVRWRAVYALVRRPSPGATPRLLELAGDPDPRVRSLAVRGLTAPLADTAGIAASAVLPVLRAAADDHDTSINAIRSLGGFGQEESVRTLMELLDGEPSLVVVAAESLGRLGPAAAVAAPALRRTAGDSSQPVGPRAAALAALVQVSPAQAVTIAAALAGAAEWRMRAAAGRALPSLDPTLRPEVARLVRDPDPRVGAATLQALVEANRERLHPLLGLLIESLGAADVQIRAAALTGLAHLRDPATLPLLLDAFVEARRDTLNAAALAAIGALGALHEAGVPAGNALVRRIVRPSDYVVHGRAIDLLGDAVRAAWGEPLPIETGRSPQDYEALVRSLVAPALEGEPLPRVRLVTEAGAIDLALAAADAPLTVESFLRLAGAGYFDGQEWPRVVPNFVIQGGDPRGDQTGGPGYLIRDELNRHRYLRGTLGMALSGPDTGGSQFFITHSPQPHLDGGYTVFGRVVDGMEVVERVTAGERIQSIRRLD